MEDTNKAIAVVRMLKQVMDSIKKNVRHEFRDMKLTGPQGMLMGTLSHGGKMKISDLSEYMGLSNSTISGMVDRLEKQGFVERIRGEKDRRVVYVNVTSEFKSNTKTHFSQIEKKLEVIMGKTTPEESDKILQGLSTLKEVMDRQ